MKKEIKRRINSSNLICHNCRDTIYRDNPYVKGEKVYCHLCEGRVKIGLFDEVIPQQYKGIRIRC